MSDHRPMFSATETLKTRRTRTAGVGPITLPRTVELVMLLIGAGGAVFGMALGALVGGGESVAWGAVIGATLAVFLAKFQPIRHHSLYRYIRLWLAARKGRAITHDGRRVRMAIGVAVVDEGPREQFRLWPGAVEVHPESYDERGVPKR